MMHVSTTPLAAAAVAGCAGVALGLAYFAALRRTVALMAGGAGWRRPAALTLLRIGGAVALLALGARLGAPTLLAVFAGFLAARTWALRQGRMQGP